MRQRLSTVASLAIAMSLFAGVACEKLNLFLPSRNEKPVASFDLVIPYDASRSGVYVVEFDATKSDDDSGIQEYRWDFGDGTSVVTLNTVAGIKPKHQYFVANGNFTVTLRVVDNDEEASEPASRRIELRRNRPPVALFAARFDNSHPHLVTFDASTSTDPDETDRDFLTYRWDFGGPLDPRTEETRNPLTQHIYPQSVRPATYLVTLTVTDPDKAESTIRAYVTVPPPTVSGGGGQ